MLDITGSIRKSLNRTIGSISKSQIDNTIATTLNSMKTSSLMKNIRMKSKHDEKNLFGRVVDWFVWRFCKIECLQVEWKICDNAWLVYKHYYHKQSITSRYKIVNGKLYHRVHKMDPYLTYTFWYTPTNPVQFITVDFNIGVNGTNSIDIEV